MLRQSLPRLSSDSTIHKRSPPLSKHTESHLDCTLCTFQEAKLTPSIQTSSIHPYPKISHPSATFRFLCAFLHSTCPVPIGPETLTFKPKTRSPSLSRFPLNPIDAYFPGANPTPDQGPLTGLPRPSITFFLLNPESLNPRPPPSSVNSAPHRGRLCAASPHPPRRRRPRLPGLQARALSASSPQPRPLGGRRPGHAAQGPSRQRRRPRLQAASAGRGRGGSQAPPQCSPAGDARKTAAGRGGAAAEPATEPVLLTSMRKLGPRSPPQRWLRCRRALLTRFSPPPASRRRADRQRRAHWLRPLWRQRVPTAPRGLIGWRGASFPRLLLIGSRAHPSRENRSPSTLLQPPTPKPGFPPARGLTANRGTERGWWVGGWAVWWGEAQPMGARRTSRLSSAAPGHPRARGSRPVPRPTILAREPGRRERCRVGSGRESPPSRPCGVLGSCHRGPWRSPGGSGYPRP